MDGAIRCEPATWGAPRKVRRMRSSPFCPNFNDNGGYADAKFCWWTMSIRRAPPFGLGPPLRRTALSRRYRCALRPCLAGRWEVDHRRQEEYRGVEPGRSGYGGSERGRHVEYGRLVGPGPSDRPGWRGLPG